MNFKRYFHPRVVATNLSAFCVMVELLILLVVIPICMFTGMFALKPVVHMIICGSLLFGLPSAVIAAAQTRRRLKRP